MGAGASTSVKQISIDQTAQRNEDRRRSGSGIAAVGRKIRRSAESKSSADRRSEQLRHALEASEKRALDSEVRTRQLEREIASLEMRNAELAEEVTWLKQQLIDRPEVPMPSRPTSSSTKGATPTIEELQQKLRTAEAKIKFHQDDAERQKLKLKTEVQKHEEKVEMSRRELGRNVVSLEHQIVELQRLLLHFEEALKKTLSDEEVDKIKVSAASSASAKRRESIISGEKKPELISELTEQIQIQRDKIAKLEREVKQQDRTTDLRGDGNSFGDSSPSQLRKPSMRPASTSSRQSFTAVRKSSATSPAPLKPERSHRTTEKVEDEIEALLKSPDSVHAQVENPFDASTRSLPALGLGTSYRGSHEPLPPPAPRHSSAVSAQRQAAGVIRPRKPRSRQNSSLNNVYTLNESLEPMRVVDTPRKLAGPGLSVRPQTADSTARNARKPSHAKRSAEYDGPEGGTDERDHNIVEEMKSIDNDGRGAHSAPMFFNKTSEPWPQEEGGAQEDNMKQTRKSKKKNRHNLGDADLESISGDSPLPTEEIQKKTDISEEVGGKGIRKGGSVSSSLCTAGGETPDEGAISDTSDDEEVKRILEMRANVADSNAPFESSGVSQKPAMRGSVSSRPYSSSARASSGKSRDSGYLGDSYGLLNNKGFKHSDTSPKHLPTA